MLGAAYGKRAGGERQSVSLEVMRLFAEQNILLFMREVMWDNVSVGCLCHFRYGRDCSSRLPPAYTRILTIRTCAVGTSQAGFRHVSHSKAVGSAGGWFEVYAAGEGRCATIGVLRAQP